MRKKRISMDKIREIIRLNQELNLGCRKIAQALGISKTAVNNYLVEFRACGLNHQDISNLTDSDRNIIKIHQMILKILTSFKTYSFKRAPSFHQETLVPIYKISFSAKLSTI